MIGRWFLQRPGNQVKSPSEFALERKIVMMVNAISSEQVGCYGG